MAEEIFFQHEIFTQFLLPFLLVWALLFGILEKTKILGENSKQLNAGVSIVISFIFVGFVFPKVIVTNLMLFLSVAIVVLFVGILIWSFVAGGELKPIGSKGLKWFLAIVVLVVVLIALLWASGSQSSAYNFLFNQSWSSSFWTNVLFIAILVGALVVVLKGSK